MFLFTYNDACQATFTVKNLIIYYDFTAPNVYSMPPVLGEAKEGNKRAAPAFSIVGRGKDVVAKVAMPGPGTYSPTPTAALKRPPAYTMAPRRDFKPPTAAVPGPGVYCPEKVNRYEGYFCSNDIIAGIIHERGEQFG